MKKFLLSLVVLISFSGCNDENRTVRNVYIIDRSHYTTQIFDGCEYIVSQSSSNLTHKGDCKNPIHEKTKIIHDTIYIQIKNDCK